MHTLILILSIVLLIFMCRVTISKRITTYKKLEFEAYLDTIEYLYNFYIDILYKDIDQNDSSIDFSPEKYKFCKINISLLWFNIIFNILDDRNNITIIDDSVGPTGPTFQNNYTF